MRTTEERLMLIESRKKSIVEHKKKVRLLPTYMLLLRNMWMMAIKTNSIRLATL